MVQLKFAAIFFISFLSFANAEVPKTAFLNSEQIEVLQAEASLAYHSKKYKDAESILQRILSNARKGSKSLVDALELSALVYRQSGDEHRAAGTYRKLIEIAPKEKHGAYQFELATIRFKQKKMNEARSLFKSAADALFNPGTSTFFLGLLDFEDKNYRMALSRFSEAQKFEDSAMLAPAIGFYVGNSYLMLGKTESAIRNFKKVEVKADSPALAKQAFEGSTKALQSLDRSQTFASLSLLTQWDSNVQSNPEEITNSAGLSNQRSMKSVVSASIAHSTSPLQDWQFTPLYSFYGNYNYNRPTRAYNFASNSLGIFVFHKPYQRLAKGFKAMTTLSMKNNPARLGETLYTKYSLTEEIGPTFKYELTPRIFLSLDALWKPKHFYGEPETGTTLRSGSGFALRSSIDAITTSALLNPQGYLALESDSTKGTQYDMTSFGLGIANAFQLHAKQSVRLSLDANFSSYPTNASKARRDNYYSARILYSYLVSRIWSWTADYSYMTNRSNIPASYSYNRMLGSLGITYTF